MHYRKEFTFYTVSDLLIDVALVTFQGGWYLDILMQIHELLTHQKIVFQRSDGWCKDNMIACVIAPGV